VILDALTDVGGAELSARFSSVKKAVLAASAERVFSGAYITEVEIRDRALAWVPEVMRFVEPAQPRVGEDAIVEDVDATEPDADSDRDTPSELAA